jgi:hypothetical protein
MAMKNQIIIQWFVEYFGLNVNGSMFRMPEGDAMGKTRVNRVAVSGFPGPEESVR